MSKTLKTNDKSLVLDTESGALLNTDENEWLRFKSERDKARKINMMEQQILQLLDRVAKLEEKIANG